MARPVWKSTSELGSTRAGTTSRDGVGAKFDFHEGQTANDAMAYVAAKAASFILEAPNLCRTIVQPLPSNTGG